MVRKRQCRGSFKRTAVELDSDSEVDISDKLNSLSLTARLNSDVEELLQGFGQRVDSIASWQRLHAPLDVTRFLPKPVFDEHWTEKDEKNMLAAWETERDHWAISEGQRADYRTLWKVCLKFAKCTPWDIIGAKTRLRFEHQTTGPKAAVDTQMWSAVFSQNMCYLVTHPAWMSQSPDGRARKIALALQYAVKLRTNDQHPWDVDVVDCDPFLAQFRSILSRQPTGQACVRKVHKEARSDCRKHGINMGLMSGVLRSLEMHIKGPREPLEDAKHYFPVTTEDLRMVIASLDEMRDCNTGATFFMAHAKLYFRVCTTPRMDNDMPNTNDQLYKWHDIALQDQVRYVELQARTGNGSATQVGSLNDAHAPDVDSNTTNNKMNGTDFRSSLGYVLDGLIRRGENELAPEDDRRPASMQLRRIVTLLNEVKMALNDEDTIVVAREPPARNRAPIDTRPQEGDDAQQPVNAPCPAPKTERGASSSRLYDVPSQTSRQDKENGHRTPPSLPLSHIRHRRLLARTNRASPILGEDVHMNMPEENSFAIDSEEDTKASVKKEDERPRKEVGRQERSRYRRAK